jgi:hypothetical protein
MPLAGKNPIYPKNYITRLFVGFSDDCHDKFPLFWTTLGTIERGFGGWNADNRTQIARIRRIQRGFFLVGWLTGWRAARPGQ